MSKCKTVQDEMKVHEIAIRTKEEGRVVERRAVKAIAPPVKEKVPDQRDA